jgi:hypothetical protein
MDRPWGPISTKQGDRKESADDLVAPLLPWQRGAHIRGSSCGDGCAADPPIDSVGECSCSREAEHEGNDPKVTESSQKFGDTNDDGDADDALGQSGGRPSPVRQELPTREDDETEETRRNQDAGKRAQEVTVNRHLRIT